MKKPKPPQALNMTREYRAEMKQLRREARALEKSLAALSRITIRAEKTAMRECNARIRATRRASQREGRALLKTRGAIDRRIGILEGRLS